MKRTVLIIIFFIISEVWAQEYFPKANWKAQPDPYASSMTEVCGTLSLFAGQSPKSLNYYLDSNTLTAEIFSAMYETLIQMNGTNLEYEPYIAKKWSISKDKLTFIFEIDPDAKWSDGKPITANDVKWTFDAILNPNNLTGVHKVSLERFKTPEILDNLTIKFTAKEVHWVNLGACGTFHILPKHVYENKDFNKINFELPVVSGLYKFGQLKEGLFLTIERRNDWWKKNDVRQQGIGNFQTLKFMFFAERENAFEAFKKGLIDLFPIYTSRIWINETSGEKFDNNWIIKQKIFNKRPVGFQGFAMNMRKPPFDDINVRIAMNMLIDRKKMNKTLMFNQYFLHRSYYEDLYDNKNKNSNPEVVFDKEAARKLLDNARWKVNPETGIREKNNEKLSFKFLTRASSTDKFLAIYAQDLKDAGIEMTIDKKDWAAWAKDMDSFNFQVTWAAWSAGIFKNPEGMWASKEAERQGGNNITGFKNKEVDKLIEKQKSIFDVSIRHDICRKIDKIIYESYPYVLLWNINYTRLLYWNKFGTPKRVLSKYGDESSAYWYWWLDRDSEDDLNDAIKNKRRLPPKSEIINLE